MSHLQYLPSNTNSGPHSKERYFLEIRNRNRWLLEGMGELILLYKRRYAGNRCPNFDQVRKTNQQHGQCDICYGTGYIGGYFKPIEILVSLVEGSPEKASIKEYGRVREFTPRSWTLWEPLLQNGDILVRRNGQRLWVTEVTLLKWKHFVTHQQFSTAEVERNHCIYKLPV